MHSPSSRSSRLRLTLLGLALSAVAGVAGAQAFSQPDDDFNGRVRAMSPVVLPGSEVEFGGMNFKPGQAVTLLRGDAVLNDAPLVADDEGRFTATVQIPDDAVVGRHPVVVRVANPDAAAVFDLKISREVPLSGQDAFEVASNKLVPGLYQVAWSAASDALFVTSAVGRPPITRSELLKLDPQTLEITARATPAAAPGRDDGHLFAVYGVGVDDANGNVWVANTRDDTVAVYRQSDLSLVKQFEAGAVPHARDVVVDEGNGRAWASAVFGNAVVAFDTGTLELLQTVEIDSGVRGGEFGPMSLAFDADAGKLYTVSMGSNEAAVIDTASGTVEKVFSLPGAHGASGVAIDAANGRLYVASQGSDNLLIVDVDSEQVLHDVYVGAGALNVSFDPSTGLAFVPSRAAGTITVVNGDGEIVANLDGGTYPNQAFNDGNGTVYAVNKARGADDPQGDHIRRISRKSP